MATGILTPDTGPAFALPFGYNGADFYGLRVDTVGTVVPSLRVSLPIDRNSLAADITYGAFHVAHAYTVRATYTVPVGRYALVTHGWCDIEGLPAGGTAYSGINVRGQRTLVAIAPFTILTNLCCSYQGYAIPLLPGNTVQLWTINNTATNLAFHLNCGILEFAR